MSIDIIESDFCLSVRHTGKQVREAFAAQPDLLCIALVAGETPMGLVNRSDFLLKYSDELGPAVYEKRSAMLIADNAPLILEADQVMNDLFKASEASSTAQLLKGFIVTRNGRYAGVSSLLTLLRATRAKAESLQALFSDLESAHQQALAADAAKTRFWPR